MSSCNSARASKRNTNKRLSTLVEREHQMNRPNESQKERSMIDSSAEANTRERIRDISTGRGGGSRKRSGRSNNIGGESEGDAAADESRF